MYRSRVGLIISAAIGAVLIVACSGTELTTQPVDQVQLENPVSDILVIFVSGSERTRQSVEKRFVAHLKAAGVDAVASIDAMPMPADLKLEKETILKAVAQFQSDAVMITNLTDVETKKVHNRIDPAELGYYGYYGSLYSYYHDPGFAGTSSTVRLRINLYDVKTEKLVWSGETKTWNKETEKEIVDDVIRVVIADLKKKRVITSK